MKNLLVTYLILLIVAILAAASVSGCAGEPMFGVAGPQGPQGPAGQDGQNGQQGEQGPQGPAGQDGQDGAAGPQGPAGQNGQDAPVDPDPVVVQFLNTTTCHAVGASHSAKRVSSSIVRVYAVLGCTGSYVSMSATGNELEILDNDGLFLVQGSGSSTVGILFP